MSQKSGYRKVLMSLRAQVRCSGVVSLLVEIEGSLPHSTRKRAVSSDPSLHATWRTVQPLASCSLSSSSVIAKIWSWMADMNKALDFSFTMDFLRAALAGDSTCSTGRDGFLLAGPRLAVPYTCVAALPLPPPGIAVPLLPQSVCRPATHGPRMACLMVSTQTVRIRPDTAFAASNSRANEMADSIRSMERSPLRPLRCPFMNLRSGPLRFAISALRIVPIHSRDTALFCSILRISPTSWYSKKIRTFRRNSSSTSGSSGAAKSTLS
mmetsp:Transcript_6622/g.18710  ORF Transcript_6622/g.18710 Transcript_6622/m.18710 type:complete len:267 (+) Transcript_6622:1276-2076(+)